MSQMDDDLKEIEANTALFGTIAIEHLKALNDKMDTKGIEYRKRWGIDAWSDAVYNHYQKADAHRKAAMEKGLDRVEWWLTVGRPDKPTPGDPGAKS